MLLSLLALALATLQVANFFINYILLAALARVPLDLLRPGPFIVTRLKLLLLAKTDRERVEAIQAGQGAFD
jgi:hypothetical protein